MNKFSMKKYPILIYMIIILGLFFNNIVSAVEEKISEKHTINIIELLKERVQKGYNIGISVAVIHPNKTEFYSYGKISNQKNS